MSDDDLRTEAEKAVRRALAGAIEWRGETYMAVAIDAATDAVVAFARRHAAQVGERMQADIHDKFPEETTVRRPCTCGVCAECNWARSHGVA